MIVKVIKNVCFFVLLCITKAAVGQSISINISSPLDNTSYVIGSNITLTATATDSTSSILYIEFLANNTSLGYASLQNTGYILNWQYVPQGNYSVIAVLTDSMGNVQNSTPINVSVNIQPQFVYDNGLTQTGNEVYLGGVANNGLSLQFPEIATYPIYDCCGDIPLILRKSAYGELDYDNIYGNWQMSTTSYDDSSTSQNLLLLNSRPGFYLGSNSSYNYSYRPGFLSSAQIIAYSGADGAGLSLNVQDSSGGYENTGIEIYSTGMDLNTPAIQLNYFPNTPAMDSVLVTDSLGYIKQRAISSFASGHWQVNGMNSYDTLDANIGIGTTNPQSKLSVNGTITAQKVKVTQTGWADYVFDSSYFLRPLTDVDKYIQEHKHLEGVPSTQDVGKNGVDLGSSQATLLQKIEELTLYLISQNREIENWKVRSAEDKKRIEGEKKRLLDNEKRIQELEHKMEMILASHHLSSVH